MSLSVLYLLDTNTIGYIVNDRSLVARRTMNQVGKQHVIAMSALVEGEVLYGVARKPEAKRLHAAVQNLFSTISKVPWDSAAARSYGTLRAQLSAEGKSLSVMDTLIAAHAVSVDAILVTHDKAFLQVKSLRCVDWATDLSMTS